MAEHTPGKWTWREIAPDDPEWGACEVWDGDTAVATHVCGVDRARLIAAAPAMLEALKCFLDDERFQISVGGNPNAIEAMLAKANAAYRSALGADASTEGGVE